MARACYFWFEAGQFTTFTNANLVHVAGYNLGVLMRALFGAGTPREAAAVARKLITILDAILRDRRSWQQIPA